MKVVDLETGGRRFMKNLPDRPAVYVMFVEGQDRPYYIGSTEDLRNRFYHGHQSFMKERRVVRVKWKLSLRWGDWLMIEKRLVDRLEPLANRGGDPGHRYSHGRNKNEVVGRKYEGDTLTEEEERRLEKYITAKKEGKLKEYLVEVRKRKIG